jgi:hypothetical protein
MLPVSSFRDIQAVNFRGSPTAENPPVAFRTFCGNPLQLLIP